MGCGTSKAELDKLKNKDPASPIAEASKSDYKKTRMISKFQTQYEDGSSKDKTGSFSVECVEIKKDHYIGTPGFVKQLLASKENPKNINHVYNFSSKATYLPRTPDIKFHMVPIHAVGNSNILTVILQVSEQIYIQPPDAITFFHADADMSVAGLVMAGIFLFRDRQMDVKDALQAIADHISICPKQMESYTARLTKWKSTLQNKDYNLEKIDPADWQDS